MARFITKRIPVTEEFTTYDNIIPTNETPEGCQLNNEFIQIDVDGDYIYITQKFLSDQEIRAGVNV